MAACPVRPSCEGSTVTRWSRNKERQVAGSGPARVIFRRWLKQSHEDPVIQGLPTAQQLAKRLIDRERTAGDGDTTGASAAALAGEELYQALSRWIGSDGCHALFARACAQARDDHPSLNALQLRARADPYINGVAESVREYGETATADSIESVLVGIVDLLGRLIGVDMATNLIERSLSEPAHADAGPEKRRAEA